MLHRLVLPRIGIAVALLIPAAACTEGDYTGDPAPSFLGGKTGAAGQTGAAGYGAAGHGTAGHGAAGSGAAGSGGKGQACTVDATGTFTMMWTLEDGTGAPATCDSLAAKTVDIDVASLDTGAGTHSTVPCAAMTAATCALPAGPYSVSMKLLADGGTLLSEITGPELYVVDGQATPIASLPFRVGGADAAMARGIAATWSLWRAGTNTAVTCDDATATKLRLTVDTKTFDFPCADGKGRTTALPPGDYPVNLRLIDAQLKNVSVTQTMTIHVGAGQLVFLGDVPFDIL